MISYAALVAKMPCTASTPLQTVVDYIQAAFSDGGTNDWQGYGITSSLAVSSPIEEALGYLISTDQIATEAGLTNPTDVPTGQVLVRAVLQGDMNLDGVVDRFDIRQFNTIGAFDEPGGPYDWSQWDMNYDGTVDRFDIRAFNTAGNFTGTTS